MPPILNLVSLLTGTGVFLKDLIRLSRTRLVRAHPLVIIRNPRTWLSRGGPRIRARIALGGSPVKVVLPGVNMANGLGSRRVLIKLVVRMVVIRAENFLAPMVTLITAGTRTDELESERANGKC